MAVSHPLEDVQALQPFLLELGDGACPDFELTTVAAKLADRCDHPLLGPCSPNASKDGTAQRSRRIRHLM